MALSKRKKAAQRFRTNIALSNETHLEYLDDRHFYDIYDRFTRWQFDYLMHFFSDLYAKEGYQEAIDFVISDLAGVGISKRDRDLERAAGPITTLLPLRALDTIAIAADMNARILRINIAICRSLMVENELPPVITEHDYFVACRKASSFEECAEIVYLIKNLGSTLSSLVKVPIIGKTLRIMRAPAHVAGFDALQEFLETGFDTFRQIPEIEHFLAEIEGRAIEIFRTIYTAPLEQLH